MQTKGNITIEDIEVGDIHYECAYGQHIKVMVVSNPVRNDDGCWDWKSRVSGTDRIIDYRVCENLVHYGPELYDYNPYKSKDCDLYCDCNDPDTVQGYGGCECEKCGKPFVSQI